MDAFKALVVKEQDGEITFSVDEITLDQLSEGEVLIKVAYSSINYKDSLAVKAKGGVIRNYPMVPGIDLAGTVASSKVGTFKEGQEVLVTGFEMGMSHTGGLSEYARVPASWVVPLPKKMTMKEAMIFGTAGFTAALSVIALEKMGMDPRNDPEVLVTGATGGVGSITLQLLKKSGYKNIYALSRKPEEKPRLEALGATKVLQISDVTPEKPRPLGKQMFHYVLDNVGGEVASMLIPQIYYGGSMSLCGMVAGIKIETTVMPFILRGVNALGIDSVNYPAEGRQPVWERIANEWNITGDSIVNEVSLEDLQAVFAGLQAGTHVGRTIVKIG